MCDGGRAERVVANERCTNQYSEVKGQSDPQQKPLIESPVRYLKRLWMATDTFHDHFLGVHIGVHRSGNGVHIGVCLKWGKCIIKSRFRLVRWE